MVLFSNSGQEKTVVIFRPSEVYTYIYIYVCVCACVLKSNVYIYICVYCISYYIIGALRLFHVPVVPHKAVADISRIGNLWERFVVVNHGWQSESTDGPKGGWSCVF